MGSDSRTATATSSKPRPSWRDRHLKQLDADQLAEVQTYRGDESPAAEASTVEASVAIPAAEESLAAESSSSLSGSKPPMPMPMPMPQAGPERGHNTAPKAGAELGSGRGREQPRSDRQDTRYESHNQHAQDHRSYRHPDDRMQRPQMAQHQRLERREEQGSRDTHERQNPRDHRENGNHAQPRIDTANAATTASPPEKKGFVATVLDYKPPSMIKYGLMAFAIAVMVTVSLLKPIDNSSQSQLDSAFTRAMIGFGLARALNGVISVAQGTEFAVQPAGVGVNFSPGEILDPINDLVERFSWVMLLSTSAIGIQKILLDVSSWTGVSVLLAGAGLFFLLTRVRNSAMTRMADIAGKLLLLMLLVRFLVPVGSLANDWVYKQFLQPQYEQSTAELELASERIKEISSRQTQPQDEENGTLNDRAKRIYSSMTSKFDFDGMLDDYKESAEEVSVNAVNLIVVFILQTIIFPLLFMYLVYRLFRSVVLPSKSTHHQ